MTRARNAAYAAVLLVLGFSAGALAAPRDHVGKLTGAAKHLQAAELSLSEAGEDFGGHKAKAAALISQAQGEITAAVEWANTH